MKKNLFFVAVLSAVTMTAAEVQTFPLPAWQVTGSKLKLEDKGSGVLSGAGNMVVTAKEFVPVEPAKSYTLKGSFRKISGEKVLLFFGFELFDKNNRRFHLAHVNAVRGSDTELLEALPKGGKTLRIADGRRWKEFAGKQIAWNTRADFSDLPNFNLAESAIESVRQDGDAWLVTLKNPSATALPAGTSLRLHQPGGTMYQQVIRNLGNDWIDLQGTTKGISKAPGIRPVVFPAGTAKVKPLIILNLGKKSDTVTEMKNVTLEIK